MNTISASRATQLPMGQVVEYLEHRPGHLVEIALDLRRTILAAVPHATETIHWGALSYHDAAHGGMVKGAICQISLCRDHVRLSFIHGVRLPDPSEILQGDRKSKRYVPIHSLEEIKSLPLSDMIRSAAQCVAAMQKQV
jgi:hypothetical protein